MSPGPVTRSTSPYSDFFVAHCRTNSSSCVSVKARINRSNGTIIEASPTYPNALQQLYAGNAYVFPAQAFRNEAAERTWHRRSGRPPIEDEMKALAAKLG